MPINCKNASSSSVLRLFFLIAASLLGPASEPKTTYEVFDEGCPVTRLYMSCQQSAVSCIVRTNPPLRLASSIASSREKLLSSPVKTNERPARQSGAAARGTGFDPGADGPASFAALEAAQLNRDCQRDHTPNCSGAHLNFG